MTLKRPLKKELFKKHILLRSIILIIITGLIFYFLFSKISFKNVVQIIISSNIYYLLLSILLLLAVLFTVVLRWYCLINTISPRFSFKDALISFMISTPLNSLLPSKMGDFFRVYYFKSESLSKIIGTIFTERIFDLFVLIIALFLSSLFLGTKIFTFLSLILLSLLIIFILAMNGLRKIKMFNINKLANKFLHSLKWVFKNPKKGFFLFFLTILIWLLSFIQIYFLFLSLSLIINFWYFIAAMVIVIFISMIPITIAGMGTRESAILFFFAKLASIEPLLAAGLLFSFTRYWLPSLLGLPFFWFIFSKK